MCRPTLDLAKLGAKLPKIAGSTETLRCLIALMRDRRSMYHLRVVEVQKLCYLHGSRLWSRSCAALNSEPSEGFDTKLGPRPKHMDPENFMAQRGDFLGKLNTQPKKTKFEISAASA